MNFRLSLNALAVLILSCFSAACQKPSGWAAYYGAEALPETLNEYELVVVDRLYPHDIRTLQEEGTRVIAYVSAGEVTIHDPWYTKAQDGGVILHENPNWPGSFVVDIKNPVWQQILFQDVLPPLAARGFDGVMLDTLDSPLAVEQEAMSHAAVDIITELRLAYPRWILIQNRGYAALKDTAPALNYLLAESTFTTYDAVTKTHLLRDQEGQNYALNYIKQARLEAPTLQVLGLEYWDPTDKKTTTLLAENMRKNKFLPFFSTLTLNQLHPQPR